MVKRRSNLHRGPRHGHSGVLMEQATKQAIKQAIKEVTAGHAERICAPGLWVVWRDETGVHTRVMQ